LNYPGFTTTPALASYSGGSDFAVSATGLNPAFSSEFFLALASATSTPSTWSDQADVAPSAAGAASHTFNAPALSGFVLRSMFVSTRDANWREVVLRQAN